MNMNHLVNRLEHERTALEHPQALDRFLRETEHPREKPAQRRFPGSNASWASIIASLGTLSMIVFAAFSLLR